MVFNITVAGTNIHCEGAGIDDTGKAARLQTMNGGEAGTNNQDQHISGPTMFLYQNESSVDIFN